MFDMITLSSTSASVADWYQSLFSIFQDMSPFISHIGLAILLGSIVGFERRKRGKVAGIRTHMVLSASACLITLCGALAIGTSVAGDPTRLAGQVMAGIGFVGAGVILKRGFNTSGVTTAATILLSSGVGIACGLGFFLMATVTAVLMFICLQVSYKIFPDHADEHGGHVVAVTCPLAKWTEVRDLFGDDCHVDRAVKNGANIEVRIHTHLNMAELNKLVSAQVHNDDILAIELLDETLS